MSSTSSGEADWAVKVLAAELSSRGHLNEMDSANLDAVVRESYHHLLLPHNPDDALKPKRYITAEWEWDVNLQEYFEGKKKDMEKKTRRDAKRVGANYLFSSESIGIGMKSHDGMGAAYSLTATPMAIIGPREVKQLREMHYKEMPATVEEAMDALNITPFNEIYEVYSGEHDWYNFLKENYHSYSNWYGAKDAIRDFVEFALLRMPEEDRNPESDKEIFKHKWHWLFNYNYLLFQLYQNGDERFTEFWMDKETLDKTVSFINELPKKEQDPALNAWLFKQGYHDIYLDYLHLYREEKPEMFMEHFSSQEEEMQEQIIGTLMRLDMDQRNEAVDTMLEKEYQPLLERVGAQYVEETE